MLLSSSEFSDIRRLFVSPLPKLCLEFEKWELSRKPIRISDDYKQNSFWSVPMI
jgi:hypothetical protein